tara:strand:+ start:292 stop:426 length:135 start_codon:yes stop_codon:yes gene_type:complete
MKKDALLGPPKELYAPEDEVKEKKKRRKYKKDDESSDTDDYIQD